MKIEQYLERYQNLTLPTIKIINNFHALKNFATKLILVYILFISSIFLSLTSQAQDDHTQNEPIHIALRDSKKTNKFPAVGLLKSGYGNCTGTLISPTLVLTAGHCIEKLIVQNSIYTRSFDGNLKSFVIFEIKVGDHLYSYKGVYGYTYRTIFVNYDVGIVLLATPVPSKLVKPMEIDTEYPDSGIKIAVLGFGCTRTKYSPELGHYVYEDSPLLGSKQIVYQKSNDPLYQGCFGDSGGPLINLDKNKIFAIMSNGRIDLSDEQHRASSRHLNEVGYVMEHFNSIQHLKQSYADYCTNDEFIQGKRNFILGSCTKASACKNEEESFYQVGGCPNHDSSYVCCSKKDSYRFESQ